jgi:DNA-binding Lrp family transcriptional regulator
MTVDELAERIGVKPSTIRKYALELEKHGLVIRYGRNVKLKYLPQQEESRLPFFFIKPSGAVVALKIRSLRQLAAVLHYNLVDDETLSYAIQSGYLAAWLRNVVGEENLAARVEELKSLAVAEARKQLVEALRAYLA